MPPVPQPRRERLAINLFDLERIHPELRQRLLKGKLDLSQAVDVDLDRVEKSKAVVFTCPLREAAMTIDFIRSENRREGDELTRAYICRERSWSRLGAKVVLTITYNGRVKLNPEVFPVEVVLSPLAPPETTAVEVGRSSD